MSVRPSIELVGSLLSLAILIGCGDTAPVGDGGNGEGGAFGPGDVPDFCADYREPIGEPERNLTVRIRNETDAPFFVGTAEAGCEGFLGFTLTDEAGSALKPDLSVCEHTCEKMLEESCGCPAICEVPQVIDIQPGGVWTTPWPLAIFAAQQMPSECYREEGCAESGCFERQTPTEPLVFHAEAFPALGDCFDECSCTPNEEGWCVLDNVTMTAGTPVEATATWNPTDFVVEIVFE